MVRFPEINGERTLAGLVESVEVVRDEFGVPHIMAQNEEDALFALGFVHAQDRLWQMEMNRRIGAGRLSEVLGSPALETDRLLRVLGLYHRAEASLEHLSAQSSRKLAAYVHGVNAWLETREGPLPPEFLILGFEPEPWSAVDSAVWPKVMSLDLGTRMDTRSNAFPTFKTTLARADSRFLHTLSVGQTEGCCSRSIELFIPTPGGKAVNRPWKKVRSRGSHRVIPGQSIAICHLPSILSPKCCPRCHHLEAIPVPIVG